MEIAGVLTAGKFLSTALEQLGKRSQPSETAGGPPLETLATPASRAAASTALREILARYDVTDISPREFSEMLRKLYEAGVLTDQQFQEVSLIRVDLDLEEVDPDEALNLLDFYLDKLRGLHESLEESQDAGGPLSADPPPPLAPIQRRLEWLAKLAAIQAAPDRVGLDALA